MSMKTGAILGEALISMRATGMRSFLTMLGIIIGVGAVVLMLAIGRGVELSVQQSISSQGANLFIILSGSTTSGGLRGGFGSAPTLTIDDARELAELPNVVAVAPINSGVAQTVNEGQNWSTQITGTTPDYFALSNIIAAAR